MLGALNSLAYLLQFCLLVPKKGGKTMAYVIAEPCIGVKDRDCVDVCPLECIYEGEDQLYINPDECIDCGACIEPCPVNAIFLEDELPEKWRSYAEKSRKFFEGKEGLPPAHKSSKRSEEMT